MNQPTDEAINRAICEKYCPCFTWATKASDNRDIFNHHPKCDGTGHRKSDPSDETSELRDAHCDMCHRSVNAPETENIDGEDVCHECIEKHWPRTSNPPAPADAVEEAKITCWGCHKDFAHGQVKYWAADGLDHVGCIECLLHFTEARVEQTAEMAKRIEELEREAKPITGETSDGYHTFNELYGYRKAYNALLFNEWARLGIYDVHKAWKHSDGELCFGGGWCIVSAQTPEGQISNHYKADDWMLFQVPERSCGNEWDGHTPQIALERLLKLALSTQKERTNEHCSSRPD